jgi:para-aminobenzoate synthetase component 1
MQDKVYIWEMDTELSSFDIFKAVEEGTDNIILDSSKADSLYSNYSIMGINPFLTVKYEDGKIFTKDYRLEDANFKAVEETCLFSYLNSLMEKYSIENDTDLPFIGGGLGYFGYDLSKKLEKLPDRAKKIVDVPDCYFVFYDNAVIHQ